MRRRKNSSRSAGNELRIALTSFVSRVHKVEELPPLNLILVLLLIGTGGLTSGPPWATTEAAAQDAGAKAGQASILLRGIVKDEAGRPVAGAVIESLPHPRLSQFRTTSKPSGVFVQQVRVDHFRGVSFIVHSADGKLASFVSRYQYATENLRPLTVVLHPLRTTTVCVIDSDGSPVPGASIHLIAGTELARAVSDDRGEAELQFPADASVDWICAIKDHLGFDYYENYDSFPTQDRLDVPNEVTLRLDGAVTVRVSPKDSKGKPISGVILTPWSIEKPGKLSYVNLSGMNHWKSNEQGFHDFHWIPADVSGTTFLSRHPDYYTPRNPRFEVSQPGKTDLSMTMLKLVTVRGSVTYPDGTPVSGVRIQGEGRGATNMYFRGYASTASDGSYEIKIYPDQDTIIAVIEKDVAAQSATGLNLPEGKLVEDVDFKLIGGTMITGQITTGKDRAPATGEVATLIQLGPKTGRLVRWSYADESGTYRFRVGPGNYTLRLMEDKSFPVKVDEQETLMFSEHADRLPRGMLRGLVVDPMGQPVEGATVLGESIASPGHAGFKTTTGADGRFASERWNDRQSIIAFDEERNLASHQIVEADQVSIDMTLRPAATLRGKVVDGTGKPQSNMIMFFQQSPPDDVKGKSVNRRTTTDESGQFTIRGVMVGASHKITVMDPSGNHFQSVQVRVDEPTDIAIETIAFEPPEDPQP